jgi:acetylornithine deacetylase
MDKEKMQSGKVEVDDILTMNTEDAAAFLCELIRFPSTRGNEGPVNRFIYDRMRDLVENAELVGIPESFKKHKEYRWLLGDLNYEGTQNVRLILGGSDAKARSLVLNAHCDVVPASKNQIGAFEPRIENGIVFGRGACDDKGQIAAIYLAFTTLRMLGLKPKGTVTVDIVVEEENGGNGTLFAIQDAAKADAAIVMEPTELKIIPAVRGAVWFTLNCTGKPGHSGRAGDVISALKLAVKAMSALEKYHDDLLTRSRGKNPLFDQFENPMPVTFGIMNAGDWPATAPATATVKGVFGFLPNLHMKEVQEGMVEALRNQGDAWLREHFDLKFDMLASDGNEISVDHPLVQSLKSASRRSGFDAEISAMTASCDAWFYNNQLGIPTVVMGAGSLKHAHSNEEQIRIADIRKMAMTLIHFIDAWSGLETVTVP